MIDIFSHEFLTQLKQDVKPKTKTSKAVLEAIKDLTNKNEFNKVPYIRNSEKNK